MRFKYETLESLFQKTDAFNERGLSLFLKLKEYVWSKLETNSSQQEVQFIKRYENMIEELQVLIRRKESEDLKKNEKKKLESGSKNPQILGGVVVDEKEFDDESLCQICCFMKIDTEFVPCQH